MKKSMIALAVLGAFAGAASAQSSVTLFGIVDAGIARVSGDTYSVTGMTNSGLNSSRLGFRGAEDLGGGMKANFWLEGALSNDDGTPGGFNFQRRSYVGLSGGFGEVRLGREYTPSFWNLTVFDAFGTNGIGSNMTIGQLASATGGAKSVNINSAAVRANNALSYSLPGGLGGFYGQLMYAFGEQPSNSVTKAAVAGTNVPPAQPVAPVAATCSTAVPVGTSNSSDGNYFGGRVGFANGPLDISLATGKTKAACVSDITATNFAAAYDFGVVKPMLLVAEEKNGLTDKVRSVELSATAPIGAGELRAAYSKYDYTDTANAVTSGNDWKKFAVGYGYNLSKRTQVYGTYAKVSNSGASAKVVSNGLAPATTAGGGSSGLEFGLRHSF